MLLTKAGAVLLTNIVYALTNTGALLLTNTAHESTAADKYSVCVVCENFNLSVPAASTASFSALLVPRKVI